MHPTVLLRGLEKRADPCCEKRAQLKKIETCVRFSLAKEEGKWKSEEFSDINELRADKKTVRKAWRGAQDS